jgi:hypothetical protein
MRRRLRRPSRVRLPTTQEPVRYDAEPPSHLVSTLVHHLHFIRPTETCHRRVIHVKYVNNKKSKQQKPKINLKDLARHLAPLPVQDRNYPDCPHDTAIFIVVTYVDDNLAFSNCETIRHQFAAHCNKRVRFNDDGPARWYLGTQYDRDPIT